MIQSLKGMKDLLDADGKLYERVIECASRVARLYGYSFILTPHLEAVELFKRSVGESTDIVGKEMYEFYDKSNKQVALRPEGTAGVVRAYTGAKLDKMGSTRRWFYHGSMFRYERPQLGRLREFHQFGVECFGVKSVYEDATVILMLRQILNELGIKASLHINSLGCKVCMSSYRELFLSFIKGKKGFCKDCEHRALHNPIRMLDCKEQACKELLVGAPKMSECLCKECKKDYETLQSLLKGEEFICDDTLVRGLDYYSKTAFEFLSDELGAKAAVAGGGRYDKLVGMLGSKEGYGLGFAIGVERICHILKQRQSETKTPLVYLCALDECFLPELFELAGRIRQFKSCILSYECKKLKKAMSAAALEGACLFVCKGEDEAKDELFYKDFNSGVSAKLSTDELLALIKELG